MAELSLPCNKAAREDLRLYLALAAIGHFQWNMRQWTRKRLLEEFKVRLTDNSVRDWIRDDESSRELHTMLTTGAEPESAKAKAALAKARKLVKEWSED